MRNLPCAYPTFRTDLRHLLAVPIFPRAHLRRQLRPMSPLLGPWTTLRLKRSRNHPTQSGNDRLWHGGTAPPLPLSVRSISSGKLSTLRKGDLPQCRTRKPAVTAGRPFSKLRRLAARTTNGKSPRQRVRAPFWRWNRRIPARIQLSSLRCALALSSCVCRRLPLLKSQPPVVIRQQLSIVAGDFCGSRYHVCRMRLVPVNFFGLYMD